MITEEQRQEFYKTVGNRYVKRIRANLVKKKILKPDGKPYSDSAIRHVLLGKFNNEDLENAFYEVCQEVKTEHLKPRVF